MSPVMNMASMPWVAATAGQASQRASSPQADEDVRVVIERFVDLLYRRRQVRAAFESCVVRTGFLDHDPAQPSGRKAAMDLLARKLADPNFEARAESIFVQGDKAVVHTLYGYSPRLRQRMDLFRVANGRIVEHWGFSEQSDLAQNTPTVPRSP